MDKVFYKKCIEVEVYEPYKEAKGRLNSFDKFWCRYIAPYSNAVYMIRKMQFLYSRGGVKRLFAKVIHTRLVDKYGITIPIGSSIGCGLSIPHPSSITISAYDIGENFKVYQNTTVGIKRTCTAPPRIGNNVTLYANSSIIGNITVCDNTIIGAHSCLLHNADIAGTYVGVPAKRIDKWRE